MNNNPTLTRISYILILSSVILFLVTSILKLAGASVSNVLLEHNNPIFYFINNRQTILFASFVELSLAACLLYKGIIFRMHFKLILLACFTSILIIYRFGIYLLSSDNCFCLGLLSFSKSIYFPLIDSFLLAYLVVIFSLSTAISIHSCFRSVSLFSIVFIVSLFSAPHANASLIYHANGIVVYHLNDGPSSTPSQLSFSAIVSNSCWRIDTVSSKLSLNTLSCDGTYFYRLHTPTNGVRLAYRYLGSFPPTNVLDRLYISLYYIYASTLYFKNNTNDSMLYLELSTPTDGYKRISTSYHIDTNPPYLPLRIEVLSRNDYFSKKGELIVNDHIYYSGQYIPRLSTVNYYLSPKGASIPYHTITIVATNISTNIPSSIFMPELSAAYKMNDRTLVISGLTHGVFSAHATNWLARKEVEKLHEIKVIDAERMKRNIQPQKHIPHMTMIAIMVTASVPVILFAWHRKFNIKTNKKANNEKP